MEIIEVKVLPNKRKTEIMKQEGNHYIIHVSAPPEKNKANKELLRFLKKHFKKEAAIIKGLSSKKKLIRLSP